jgi:hypothetical protein
MFLHPYAAEGADCDGKNGYDGHFLATSYHVGLGIEAVFWTSGLIISITPRAREQKG